MSIADQLAERIKAHGVDLVQQANPVLVEIVREGISRRTGALADGVQTSDPGLADTQVRSTIESRAPYSRYQDEGTGIYGPTGARIFPTHAKVLRFDSPAAGGIVYARSVAGAPGTHFWDKVPAAWHEALAAVIG